MAKCVQADTSLGPLVPVGCRDGFDFTLDFEQIILSSVPSFILILVSAHQILLLRNLPSVSYKTWNHHGLKLVCNPPPHPLATKASSFSLETTDKWQSR